MFDPAQFSVVRVFLRWASRTALVWFYREITVVRLGTVPGTGPVLLVGNHPNDLPDVTLGLQATTRHVRYLATISAGTGGTAEKGYRAMGVIPVTRVRDARKMRAMGVDMAAVNAEAGRLVSHAFAAGHVVGVFPQGGVQDVPSIGRLRTGIAMMALASLDSGAVIDITVVPFGVQYEAPRTPGSDAMVVVGRGWSLRGWRAEREAGGLDAGAAALTEQLRHSLLGVTRNAADWLAGEERDELIAALVAAERPSQAPLLERAARMVPLAEALVADRRSDAPTSHAARLHTLSSELAHFVEEAGGLRTSARDHARLLHAAGVAAAADLTPVWQLLLLTPAAMLGWLVHGPLFTAIWALAHRLAKARADVVARAFVPGLHLTVLWYLTLALFAGGALVLAGLANGLSLLVVAFLTAMLPIAADTAVRWRHGWRAHALVWRVRRWPASRHAEITRVTEALRAEWRTRSVHNTAV
jgi:hypothetical protein